MQHTTSAPPPAATLGDKKWPPKAKQEGTKQDKQKLFHVIYGTNVLSDLMLEVSLLGIGKVLHLERGGLSMVK